MADPKIVVKYNNVEVPGDLTNITVSNSADPYTIEGKVFVNPAIYKYDATNQLISYWLLQIIHTQPHQARQHLHSLLELILAMC